MRSKLSYLTCTLFALAGLLLLLTVVRVAAPPSVIPRPHVTDAVLRPTSTDGLRDRASGGYLDGTF